MIRIVTERFDHHLGMHCSNSTLGFQQCLYDLEFMDSNHIGPTLTWTNKRSFGFVAKKLDKFLANDCWFQVFLDFIVKFTPPFSDHCAGRLLISNHTV